MELGDYQLLFGYNRYNHAAHSTVVASVDDVVETMVFYFRFHPDKFTVANDGQTSMTPEDARLSSELEERLQLMTLVADLSAKFIGIPAGKIDHEINDSLQKVCDFLGLDVGVLWQWELGMPATFVVTHFYRPLGGPPVPERLDCTATGCNSSRCCSIWS